MSSSLPSVGSRVVDSSSGHRATVRYGDKRNGFGLWGFHSLWSFRYVGAVDGSSGDWIGVEWDDHNRGRHDGTKDGKRYFNVKEGTNGGSFVRAKKLDLGITLQRGTFLKASFRNGDSLCLFFSRPRALRPG